MTLNELFKMNWNSYVQLRMEYEATHELGKGEHKKFENKIFSIAIYRIPAWSISLPEKVI